MKEAVCWTENILDSEVVLNNKSSAKRRNIQHILNVLFLLWMLNIRGPLAVDIHAYPYPPKSQFNSSFPRQNKIDLRYISWFLP